MRVLKLQGITILLSLFACNCARPELAGIGTFVKIETEYFGLTLTVGKDGHVYESGFGTSRFVDWINLGRQQVGIYWNWQEYRERSSATPLVHRCDNRS